MEPADQKNELESLRLVLRTIDDEIMRLVMRRMEVVHDIGMLKRLRNIEILDQVRESFNKERSHEITKGQLPTEMVDQLTDLLAYWARDVQAQMR
jgi:chorismate mutase